MPSLRGISYVTREFVLMRRDPSFLGKTTRWFADLEITVAHLNTNTTNGAFT